MLLAAAMATTVWRAAPMGAWNAVLRRNLGAVLTAATNERATVGTRADADGTLLRLWTAAL